jgi:CDP-4-dehydro-6-deoxyglucose reductase, E1
MQNKLTDGNKRVMNVINKTFWLGGYPGLSGEMLDFSIEKTQALFGVNF